MLIGLQDWIHLLVLPFAQTKREEELEMVKTVNKKFIIMHSQGSNPIARTLYFLSFTTTLGNSSCNRAPRVFKERLATRATQAKSAPRDSRDSRLVQPWFLGHLARRIRLHGLGAAVLLSNRRRSRVGPQ